MKYARAEHLCKDASTRGIKLRLTELNGGWQWEWARTQGSMTIVFNSGWAEVASKQVALYMAIHDFYGET